MHDPTEGGLVTGLHELARAAGVGLTIDAMPSHTAGMPAPVPALHPPSPGTLASGSLLICVAPHDVERVRAALQAAGVLCTQIGHIMSRDFGCKMRSNGVLRDLPIHERDEVTKIL